MIHSKAKHRALANSTKMTVRIAIIVVVGVAMFAVGVFLGFYLGWFAPLITIPTGFVGGSLAAFWGRKWMDHYPSKELV